MADWKLHYPFGSPKFINAHAMAMLDQMRAKRQPQEGEVTIGEVGEFGAAITFVADKFTCDLEESALVLNGKKPGEA